VKRSDIGRNAVNSANVANGSLRRADFRARDIPAGPPGQPGAPGSPGSPAASMLMGHVPAAATNENANAKLAYPPIGVDGGLGATMTSPNQTVVVRDLYVRLSDAPGAGASRTAYIGVVKPALPLPPDPAISCAITDSATTCDSGDATVTIPPGTRLTFAVVNGATPPGNTTIEFGYRATTP